MRLAMCQYRYNIAKQQVNTINFFSCDLTLLFYNLFLAMFLSLSIVLGRVLLSRVRVIPKMGSTLYKILRFKNYFKGFKATRLEHIKNTNGGMSVKSSANRNTVMLAALGALCIIVRCM